MFQAQFTGKIVAVFNGNQNADGSINLICDVQQKTFKDGKLVNVNWRLLAPRHKENWLKRQMDKGYTVCIVLSDITFYDDRGLEDKSKPTAFATLQEVLTL